MKNIAYFFISSDKTLSSEKNDTKIIEIGFKFWFCGHFSKHSHSQFSLHSRDISVRDNGFSYFQTLLLGRPLIRVNRTKRDLYPPKVARADLTKFVNNCVSRNGCRINTTKPNHMILVSFFSKDNVSSDEIKICSIFEYQSNKIWAFRFFFFFFLGGGGVDTR